MKIRVVREIGYEYDNVQAMVNDIACWTVRTDDQWKDYGDKRIKSRIIIVDVGDSDAKEAEVVENGEVGEASVNIIEEVGNRYRDLYR